jgi:cyclic-di-GMP phosphodiesterase TipF (flagellum assembly factor)
MEKLILMLLSAALASCMLVFLVVWNQLKQVRRYCRQLNTAIQRLDHDIAQQRYALAALRPKDGDPALDAVAEFVADDEGIMNLALSRTDDAIEDDLPNQPAALDDLRPNQVLQFLKKAIKNNDIAVTLQPIVKLPQRSTSFFEVYARIKVGEQGYISAQKFISVARDNNLIAAVDNLLLLRCLQLINKSASKDSSVAYFVNIAVSTLANKTYVSDLIRFLSANPKLSSRLVFEITQMDSLKTSQQTKQVMEGLSLLGCRFSMDQVTMLGLDVERLADQNISFVKLDAQHIIQEISEQDKRNRLKKLKNMLEAAGISVIMEKIENERQLLNLVDLYIDYAQGYLFGRPEAVGV